MASPSIELFEDQRLLEIVNSRTVVGDTYPHVSLCTFRCQMDGGTWRRILRGVFQQVTNDFGNALLINSHAREIGGDSHFNFAIVEHRPKLFQRAFDGAA